MTSAAYVYSGRRDVCEDRVERLSAALSKRDQWSTLGTTSRNALLSLIAADEERRRPAVALLDLRSDPCDLRDPGFDLIETIRRHPRLSSTCRPLVWTSNVGHDTFTRALRAGAYGVVHAEHARRRPASLREACRGALEQPASRYGVLHPECPEWADSSSDAERDRAGRARRFTAFFGFAPGPYDFELLWGLAHGISLGMLAEELSARHGYAAKTIRKRVNEKLDPVLRLELPADARIEAERPRLVARVISDYPPFRPAVARLDWPNLEAARQIWGDPAHPVRDVAFIAPSEESLLDEFFAAYVAVGGRRVHGLGGIGKVGDQHRAALAACDRLAAGSRGTREEVAETARRCVRVLLAATIDLRRQPDATSTLVESPPVTR